jgi:deoxyribodipyrimidine photo-lyase
VAVDRCDPQGLFIRRWLPELAGLTNDQLGSPPPMADYPRPILDYDSARLRRLEILERRRLQIRDPSTAMARLPAAMPELFPAALDLDQLDPAHWRALLSWFQPGRRPVDAVPADGSAAAAPPTRRRSARRAGAPGQLSLDLALDLEEGTAGST